jgi:5-oxoprolinase (ATP-hydrolysing)
MLLRELKVRRGSGGRGRYNGGDGMERTFEARQDVNCSIVSQRRVFPPLGMKGGGNGAKGVNTWRRKNEEGGFDDINVGNNGLCRLRKGDIFNVKTPGGGGWGRPENADTD